MKPAIVAGLYRSGTNFTQRVIDLNLEVRKPDLHPHTLRYPYKHAINEVEAAAFTPEVKVVYVYKTPDRWLASVQRLCYEMPFLYDLAWEEGHTPIEVTCDSEYGRLPKKVTVTCSVEKLLVLYKSATDFWMERADIVVRYEDVLFDTDNQLTRIAAALGVARRDVGLSVPLVVASTDDWSPARKEAYRQPPDLPEEVAAVVSKFDYNVNLAKVKKPLGQRTPPIEGYRVSDSKVDIVPGQRKREWLDPHTYRCLPVALANEHGWDIVSQEDMVVWTKGGELQVTGCGASCHFGMKTFTLPIGLTWKTPYNVQILLMPAPNLFSQDWVPMTAIIEADSLKYPFFLTIKALASNFTIPAGTVLARVMPVTLSGRPELRILPEPRDYKAEREVNAVRRDRAETGEWLRFYHDNVRYKANPAKVTDVVADTLLVVSGFLSAEECHLMKDTYDQFPSDANAEYEDDYWRGRCHRPEDAWPDSLQAKFAEAMELARKKWGGRWEAETWQMTTWPAGMEMPAHRDYAFGNYPHRDYAAIIYFNDGYEGGNLFLPDFPSEGTTTEIAPAKGSLVIFPGGDTLHGVRKITSGTRLTAITWMKRHEHEQSQRDLSVITADPFSPVWPQEPLNGK